MALTTVPVELANLDGAVTINESSADVDFRVESNDSANMLVVDAGNNKVLVEAQNTASVTDAASMIAASAFEINGNAGEGSDILRFFAMADGTGNYGMEVSNSSGASTYDLCINPINAGSVGIGTTSPAAAKFSGSATPVLQVKGATPAIAVTESDVSDAEVYMGMAGGNAYFGSTGSGTLQIGKGATSTVNAMVINNDGHVTMPLQSSFIVSPSAQQSDLSNGTTIVWGTETVDRNGDFASNTFTAPVTGQYLLSVVLRLRNGDSGANYMIARIETSNRHYDFIASGDRWDANPNYWSANFSTVADMDANDTVTVEWYQSGGSNQVDVESDSRFSGHLLG